MSDASQHPSTFTQRALRWTIGAKRERYEELVHIVERTAVENLEMAECCLSLIEEGVFSMCQAQHVRQLLKQAEARRGD